MLSIDSGTKTALQSPIKRVRGYIVLEDGTEIHPDDLLQKYTITAAGGLLKTSMSKIDLTLLGEHNLKGTSIDVYYGVFYDDDWHYVLKGKFNILEAVYKKDTETTELVGYDNMVKFMKTYLPVSDFPTTLQGFTQSLSAGVGVTLATIELYNGALTMPEDYWATIPEATYRDVLQQICEVTVSNARINPAGELELIPIDYDSGETLTYENLLEYKLENSWGNVNSVVLSRQPQNDDIFLRDEDAINTPTNKNILDLNKFNVSYVQGGE